MVSLHIFHYKHCRHISDYLSCFELFVDSYSNICFPLFTKHIKLLFYQDPINNEIIKAPASVARGSIDYFEDESNHHGKKPS